MTRKYVDEQWQSFRQKCLPKAVSHIQLVETRRGFYAGAGAMFDILVQNAPDDESDMTLMEDIKAEFIDWQKRLERREV